MPNFNSLSGMLLLLIMSVVVACLGAAFQHYQTPGQIFNWYRNWLIRLVDDKVLYEGSPCFMMSKPRRFLEHFVKPLGLCIYCNTVWLAILFYIPFYLIPYFSFITVLMLFDFIGMTFIWTKIYDKFLSDI